MILKSYETNKINFNKNKIFLLYGENKGYIQEIVDNFFLKKNTKNIFKYTENEILDNLELFYNQIFTSSFFENDKTLIISQITNKFEEIVNSILEKEIDNTKIILIADRLEKKSKIRSLFEKNDKLICIPFYADDKKILGNLIREFFIKKKIKISQSQINLILSKIVDRKQLKVELDKLEMFLLRKSNLKDKEILKLINISENYSASELIDSYLSKNKKKIVEILNENIFNLEENLMIIRVFLSKLKRLKRLKSRSEELKGKNSQAISEYKPPIFWKEKEIISQQLNFWTLNQLSYLFKNLIDLEIKIKKNYSNSSLMIGNFFLEN